MLAQPGVQALLRANDHRTNIPQCIIEIEGDRAQVAEPGRPGTRRGPGSRFPSSCCEGYHPMSDLTLVIGNRNYSSWSLRPWMLLQAARPRVPRDRDPPRHTDDRRMRSRSTVRAGGYPCCSTGSSASGTPSRSANTRRSLPAGGWPRDPAARAVARSRRRGDALGLRQPADGMADERPRAQPPHDRHAGPGSGRRSGR